MKFYVIIRSNNNLVRKYDLKPSIVISFLEF